MFAKRIHREELGNSGANSSHNEDESIDVFCDNCLLTDEKVNDVQDKIAKLFYRTGISFRLADSEAFKDVVKSLNPALLNSIPSSRSLAGNLLDKQHDACMQLMNETLATKQNLTLISDGWTNVRHDHIVNFCIKAPGEQPFFYSSIDTSGITQNATAVGGSIIEVIEEIGAEKFSCLITDNAAVMRATWEIIEEKYPHISANGCAAHVNNLLLKDIIEIQENMKILKEAEKIIMFIMNHHIVRAKYEEKRNSANVPRTLSMPVVTRWFSRFSALSNLQASKYVLIQLVDDDGDLLNEIAP